MAPDETTQSAVENPGTSPEAPQSQDKPIKSSAEAVVDVFNTLQPYDDATRQKILGSVMTLLGINSVATSTASVSPSGSVVGSVIPTSSRRQLSPAELIQAKEPATNAQRIIVFAYYRERYENITYFARDDLQQYFSKARLAKPANYDRDFNDALKQGWLYENGNESYLTGKGFQAVETGFGGKAAPRGRSVKSKSSKTPKKENSTEQQES